MLHGGKGNDMASLGPMVFARKAFPIRSVAWCLLVSRGSTTHIEELRTLQAGCLFPGGVLVFATSHFQGRDTLESAEGGGDAGCKTRSNQCVTPIQKRNGTPPTSDLGGHPVSSRNSEDPPSRLEGSSLYEDSERACL